MRGEDMYRSMRAMALAVRPDQIGYASAEEAPEIFGVVMDWNIDPLDRNCVTLVAFANGEASLYLSSGGGMIGASKHETVRAAALDFVAGAALVLDKTEAGPALELPLGGAEKFILLTRTESRHIERTKGPDWDEDDALDALSMAAQALIGEISRVQ